MKELSNSLWFPCMLIVQSLTPNRSSPPGSTATEAHQYLLGRAGSIAGTRSVVKLTLGPERSLRERGLNEQARELATD